MRYLSSGMSMKLSVMIFLAFVSTAAAAEDIALRAKLSGEWVPEAAGANEGTSWVLANNDQNIHVTEMQKQEKLADFSCNTVGKECSVKEKGKSVKVSFWFSGTKLVEMETRGNEVVKRRFQA